MECIKTGCVARIGGHRGYIYGDAFLIDMRTLLIRVCKISPEPNGSSIHFDILSWATWFDERHTSQVRNSTLIVAQSDYLYHGYNGVPTNV